MEQRSIQILTNVEPSIAAAITAAADARKCSLSTYVRNVLIYHLIQTGKFSTVQLAGILTGDTMHLAKEQLLELLNDAEATPSAT